MKRVEVLKRNVAMKEFRISLIQMKCRETHNNAVLLALNRNKTRYRLMNVTNNYFSNVHPMYLDDMILDE